MASDKDPNWRTKVNKGRKTKYRTTIARGVKGTPEEITDLKNKAYDFHEGRRKEAKKESKKLKNRFNPFGSAEHDYEDKKKLFQDDFEKDKDLLLRYGLDAPKSRSFMTNPKLVRGSHFLGTPLEDTYYTHGYKKVKMRGGGIVDVSRMKPTKIR